MLRDPYTNILIVYTRGPNSSRVVQIDRVVALANAWQAGAQQLSMAARTDMANGPFGLLAVSGEANQ